MIVAGVLIALYAGAIVAGKVRAGLFFNAFVYALPMLLLLCTIVLSARVFDPAGYFSDDYPTLFKRKEKRLRQSLLSLELAVALLAVSVFFYLLRPASIP
jgi:hypothetical protein